jgi:small subunit ribosomal protein S19e
MADIRSIEAGKFNKLLAEKLKESGDFEAPEWINFVKTGPHKQRPVFGEDFWFVRAASILRQVYIKKVVGVERLRTRYGGRKDRGARPPHFVKSGGKIIRTLMQQAEKAGYIEKSKGKKAGRQLTLKGKELMEGLVK